MSIYSLQIVGLGEILWDMLPGGKQMGGAPANFAYMADLLGDKGIVASRVGNDPLGAELLRNMEHVGLTAEQIQLDTNHATGVVQVKIDESGQPDFTIIQDVAWDFLQWTPAWEELAHQAEVVCFGTLAQRFPASRATIHRFLEALSNEALRIFDVNLRQNFFSAEIIDDSLTSAHIVKLNADEVPVVANLLQADSRQEKDFAKWLLHKYDLKLVCITRGERGSLLVGPTTYSEHTGFRVKVIDTVGSGDAFTACLAHYYLRGYSLDHINEVANRFAAWVATQAGATPFLNGEALMDILSKI